MIYKGILQFETIVVFLSITSGQGFAAVQRGHLRADRVVVDAKKCPWVDGSRVAGLLRLEVVDVLRRRKTGSPVQIRIECRRDIVAVSVAVSVADPVTNKFLRRRVASLRSDTPGKELILALSASQLLLASWMELLGPNQVKQKKGSAGGLQAARRLAVALVRRSGSVQPSMRLSLSGLFHSSAVDLGHPFAVFSGRVRQSVAVAAAWQLAATASVYGGQADRVSGRVRLVMGWADLGGCLDIAETGAILHAQPAGGGSL